MLWGYGLWLMVKLLHAVPTENTSQFLRVGSSLTPKMPIDQIKLHDLLLELNLSKVKLVMALQAELYYIQMCHFQKC